MNDSLLRTCLCTRHGAAEVAAGALHLAILLLGASMELPHSSRLGWCGTLLAALLKRSRIRHNLHVCCSHDLREGNGRSSSPPLV